MKKWFYLAASVVITSCGGSFLDIKPTLNQRVPSTIADFMGLMDNRDMMNRFSSHALGLIGSDELYMSDVQYNAFPVGGTSYNYQKNAYTWNEIIYEGGEPMAIDWSRGYTHILWANMTLDGLENIAMTNANRREWNNTKGMALFHRALNFYNLAQLHAPQYDNESASKPGLPLRLEPDVTAAVPRATVAETYDRIIKDLEAALPLLDDFPAVVYRPSRWAVLALLARVHLQMGDYAAANDYSTQCLQLRGELLDFNSLDLTQYNPFPLNGEGNPEMILNTTVGNDIVLLSSYCSPDTTLYETYEQGDLRKIAFFKFNDQGIGEYTGSYDGGGFDQGRYFSGLATDEVYLIKAETDARLDKLEDALATLNKLKQKRIVEELFIPYKSADREQIIAEVLLERRKELFLRGTRWADLKRLNREEQHAKTLIRVINGIVHSLPPNDNRYIWPLPLEAVSLGEYEQNPR